MISNYKIVVQWEDLVSESIFTPIIPSIGDSITTPTRYGIVNARHIHCVNRQVIVYANSEV